MSQVKRITSAILAVLMVLSLSSVAFAAPAPKATISAAYQNGQNVVTAYLSGDNITNGRVEISYDPSQVVLLSAVPGNSSWITSINTVTPGVVSFAWVGSSIHTDTLLVTLVFGSAGSNPYTSYTLSASELYSNGAAQPLPANSISTITSPGAPGFGGGSGTSGGSGSGSASHPFTDIAGHWAEKDIIAAWQAAIFTGTGNGTTFSPNMELSRAMLATVLYRMAGEPAVSGTHPFSDTADGLYYSKAVIWAYNSQIVNGTGDGTTFSPDMAVTREQMVAMLYRYAKHIGKGAYATTSLDRFSDSSNVSSWAEDAMKWAVAEGIISGTPEGTLLPQTSIDRAQAAAVLVRFLG